MWLGANCPAETASPAWNRVEPIEPISLGGVLSRHIALAAFGGYTSMVSIGTLQPLIPNPEVPDEYRLAGRRWRIVRRCIAGCRCEHRSRLPRRTAIARCFGPRSAKLPRRPICAVAGLNRRSG